MILVFRAAFIVATVVRALDGYNQGVEWALKQRKVNEPAHT